LEQGIAKLSLDKGNKLKEGHGDLPRKGVLCVCGEVFMGRECARIKHGRKLCV